METHLKEVAEKCLRGAHDQTMTFPQVVGLLMQAGFESYSIDYRRAKAIYYRPDGDSVELAMHRVDVPIAAALNTPAIQTAIAEAQQLVPDYTYEVFCRKTMGAGCVGYVVSFSGRRAVYFGRDAKTHVEHFPE